MSETPSKMYYIEMKLYREKRGEILLKTNNGE